MRRVVYAGLGAMVAATGGYVVVYLARWEWQRALMAGELLLVSLIVLVAVAGAHRLGRLERRLGELAEGDGAGRGAPVRLAAVPSQRPAAPFAERAGGGPEDDAPRFRWLEPDQDAYRVFIPVLLGAGILVSGLAALVERVATALGRGGATSGRVRLPRALTVPSGGVLAGAPDLAPPGPDRRARLRVAAWALAVALVAAMVVQEMAERTQDRPDAPVGAVASTLVVQASTHGNTGAATADPLATRLWEYCKGSTRPYVEDGGVVPIGGRRYAFVARPALGEHALRRMKGCLEDAVIDGGRFRVVAVEPADD